MKKLQKKYWFWTISIFQFLGLRTGGSLNQISSRHVDDKGWWLCTPWQTIILSYVLIIINAIISLSSSSASVSSWSKSRRSSENVRKFLESFFQIFRQAYQHRSKSSKSTKVRFVVGKDWKNKSDYQTMFLKGACLKAIYYHLPTKLRPLCGDD